MSVTDADAQTTLILDRIERVHTDTREQIAGVHSRIARVEEEQRAQRRETGEFRVEATSKHGPAL